MAFGISNISTEMLPSAAKHVHFIIELDMTKCDHVQDLPPGERCEFVQGTEACTEDVRIGNYMYLMYCLIGEGSSLAAFGVLLMVLVTLLCFMIMGLAADLFFVPALAYVSNLLGLSESVAGVTLLALGNGSPDLITTFNVITEENEMMFCELVGAAVFVTSVVTGAIITVSPFKVYSVHFMRDALFFLSAILFIDWTTSMENNLISIYEATVPITIYLFYLTVVIVDQVMSNKAATKARSKVDKEATTLDVLLRYPSSSSVQSVSFSGQGPNEALFIQFAQSLNPIDVAEWINSGIFPKIFMIIKVPIIFGLQFFIPKIEPELETLGWSKLLNCMQLITLPALMYCIEIDPEFEWNLNGFPVIGILLLICFSLSVTFFFTSRTDTIPKFQIVFVVLSITGAVFMIYIFADEVVNVLQTIGIYLSLSMSFLGATVLAWGNSIGDLISDLALARQGYVQMGFAGCYGGPMFNILTGLGMTMIYKCVVSPELNFRVHKGYLGNNCLVFLLIVLYFTIGAMLLTNFVARRSIGIFLIILYVLFFTMAILSELEVIHAFGTNHA